ncbi:MaoC family dehydratase [Paracoccus aerius]|uniref:MaoC family dehydratase n=1 Tax=Paracoccus aerius TaxID=1915382 RepID=A0ABS1S9A0_9RHOB|nr:MaoC family dehydratase [Paracoccus aerius]MBL3675303.1 MaoC family dehydratase [Paracoccus aerius]GHG20960.1 hypothetical protein GCM10017322_17780 [Paracoccus aerius]
MTTSPATLEVVARLDDNPRYRGSVHDDTVAQRMGYRAALLPGAFVYTYAARLAVSAWGMDWVEAGGMAARFRRPVFDGDLLTITADAEDASGRCPLSVTNQLGEQVMTGSLDAPLREVPTVDLSFHPHQDPREPMDADRMQPGQRFNTTERVLTAADIAASRTAMCETHPVFLHNDVAHPGCLVRLTMDDVLRSFALPMPPIFTEVETRHFCAVRPGDSVSTSAMATRVFERGGKHYFISEEYLVLDGSRIAARHLRTNLFQIDQAQK